MQINNALLSQIEAFLEQEPLVVGKITRVKGLGEKYLAHADVEVPENYKAIFELTIKEVKYNLYIVAPHLEEDFSS